MDIQEELNKEFNAYRNRHKDYPNSKPEKILMNEKAYQELLHCMNMQNKPNPTITHAGVVVKEVKGQSAKIRFIKRESQK